jgi:hypothetical protein
MVLVESTQNKRSPLVFSDNMQRSACLFMVGSEDHAAVTPLWGSDATLTGSTGMLLGPWFTTATGDLCPGFGVVGPVALVALVDNHGLVHQGWVHGHIKDDII